MKFTEHDITNSPTHLISLSIADINNDGLPDMITGGMHTFPPFDRMGRVTLWMNNGNFKKRNN
jgi:hypothetical protein